MIYKIKGPDRICLVTDSMRAAGMPDGEYLLGSKQTGGILAIVEDEIAKLPDRSAFAGSVATADRLVRTFWSLTGAPVHEVIKMISLTPAKLLHIDRTTGSIAEGKQADLTVFDDSVDVKMTVVAGEITYQKEKP